MYTHIPEDADEPCVVDGIEAALNVPFDDPMVACLVADICYPTQCHVRIAHGPEAIRVLVELRFHDGFEYQPQAFLDNPVQDGGYAERSLFILTGFGDPDSADGYRLIVLHHGRYVGDCVGILRFQHIVDVLFVRAIRVASFVALDVMDGRDNRDLGLCHFQQAMVLRLFSLVYSLFGRGIQDVLHNMQVSFRLNQVDRWLRHGHPPFRRASMVRSGSLSGFPIRLDLT